MRREKAYSSSGSVV